MVEPARPWWDEADWVVPTEWLPSDEFAKRRKADWYCVYPESSNTRPPPICYGALTADLQRRLDADVPQRGVLELPNALLFGEAGWVFSRDGHLLPDHSWYGRHVDEMRIPRRLPRARRLKGVCLSLASDFSVGSYGHFLLDSISRLELFTKAGFHLTDVDCVFCPKPTSNNAQKILESLDIPMAKFVWADGSVAIRPDTLLAPTFPGTRRNYSPWVPDFLKRAFLPSTPRPHRRLYVSRSGARRNVVNEEAVQRIVLQHGFEIYDPSRQTDTTRDFAEATVVVGPHGGGLTDLAFCQPGTKVLELIPTDHIYPYYYTLSDAADLEYGYLLCRSTTERDPDAFGPSSSDFHVDEREFAVAVDRITSKSFVGLRTPP